MEGKLPIVAFDNDPGTLDWIERGAITATITQSLRDELLRAEVPGRPAPQRGTPIQDWRTALATPMPTFVDTGTVVVDKTNLKVYREALTEPPPRRCRNGNYVADPTERAKRGIALTWVLPLRPLHYVVFRWSPKST